MLHLDLVAGHAGLGVVLLWIYEKQKHDNNIYLDVQSIYLDTK
jgi:hypothetical protein